MPTGFTIPNKALLVRDLRDDLKDLADVTTILTEADGDDVQVVLMDLHNADDQLGAAIMKRLESLPMPEEEPPPPELTFQELHDLVAKAFAGDAAMQDQVANMLAHIAVGHAVDARDLVP